MILNKMGNVPQTMLCNADDVENGECALGNQHCKKKRAVKLESKQRRKAPNKNRKHSKEFLTFYQDQSFSLAPLVEADLSGHEILTTT